YGWKKTELLNVEKEIEDLGGLKAYQRMSVIGQGSDRGGRSEKVLVGWWRDMELHKLGAEKKLRLLKVGALEPDNYASCSSWIENTPMDLNSRHPAIIEQDFLLLDQESNREKWDVISLSLVLNFVPEPLDRVGVLIDGGHLFVACHWREGGKMVYYFFRKQHTSGAGASADAGPFQTKRATSDVIPERFTKKTAL
ncbi:putative methyltransferase-domain-containing protein, partial [Lentinula raphanica]